jgi:hypothetical protein
MPNFVPVAAFVLLLPLCAAGQPFSFSTRTDLATASAVSVASADFNGDGVADLAVLNSRTIQIFLGEGDRRFAAPITIQLNAQPNTFGTLVAADINGDGKPDLIASGGSTAIFFGNGDGTFTAGPSLAIGGNQVATADFNLDGNLDLAINTGSAIDVLVGNGKGGFSNPVVLSGAPDCLAVGDFNGDGKPDVVGCGFNPGNDPAVAVFLGSGNGTFQSPIWSLIPSQASYAAAGDLNGDGKPDVAAVAAHENGSNPNIGPVFILYGNGDGTFQAAQQLHTEIGPLTSVAIADWNGDGLPDLAAASIGGLEGDGPFFVGSFVGTYFNLGAGQGFALHQAYPVTAVSGVGAALLTADLTGNHTPDIVTTDPAGAYLSILFNDGKGDFADVPSYNFPGETNGLSASGSPYPVAQADFNGDGIGDLAMITENNGDFELTVFFGTGDASQPYRAGPATVLGTVSASFPPESIVAGDFRGNGKPDVAIAYLNLVSNTAYVQDYLGHGDGTFTAGRKLSVPIPPFQMIAADFNGDGKLDLASTSGFVALGNGDGTFQTPIAFYPSNAGTYGVWLGAADFNHDGKLDLAFQTNEGTDSLTQPLLIYLGKGDGTFQSPTTYTWGYLPSWGVITDLNGDGNPDIVILSSQHPTDSLAVFLGNPDGTFQSPALVTLPFVVSPDDLVAADFNGDGNVDLAIMDSGINAVYLVPGSGDGTFGRVEEMGGASTQMWMGIYASQSTGYADLVTFNGALNTFVAPSGPAGVSISLLRNAGARQ